MEITYLGHQGWSFKHKEGIVLMDAIFHSIGNGAARLPVWPCRKIKLENLTNVKALIISHEHSDHFDLDTLVRYRFRCDVWIPYLSSSAMADTLKQLGYRVKRMQAFHSFKVGGITFTPLPMNHNKLEFDVYGMLAQDQSRNSFLTIIDAIPSQELDYWLKSNCPKRTLDNFTNNFIEPLPFLSNDHSDPNFSLSQITKELIGFVERFEPENCLITGQGWCYSDKDLNHLNNLFFNVNNRQLTEVAKKIFPHINWDWPAPGSTFILNRNKVTAGRSDIVKLERSPNRVYRNQKPKVYPVKPWSKTRNIPPEELSEVFDFISKAYGKVLEGHAPYFMKGLHYLIMHNIRETRPTLFVRIKNGSEKYDFQLHYGILEFDRVQISGNPFDEYVAGIEIWASDLKLLINAQEEAFLIYESSVIRWNHQPEILGYMYMAELFTWFAPRYRSKEYAIAYETTLNLRYES
jgi:hypothetical protein